MADAPGLPALPPGFVLDPPPPASPTVSPTASPAVSAVGGPTAPEEGATGAVTPSYRGFTGRQSTEGLNEEQKQFLIDSYSKLPGVGAIYVNPDSIDIDMRSGLTDAEGKPIGGGGGVLSPTLDASKIPQVGRGLMLEKLNSPEFENLRPDVKARIREKITQWAETERAYSIAEEAALGRRNAFLKDQAEVAFHNYSVEIEKAKRLPSYDYGQLTKRIINDPAFSMYGQMMNTLLTDVGKISGEEQEAGMGVGYHNARQRLMPGAEDHINSVEQILEIPTDQLTRAGRNDLIALLGQMRKPDEAGIEQTKTAKLKASYNEMVRPEAMGGMIKDHKGELRYERDFVPVYLQAFSKWRQDNPGKSPYEFLMDEKLRQQLVEAAYPKKERDIDAQFADTPEAARDAILKQETPAVPSGINAREWNVLVHAPPYGPDGKPWSFKAWGVALQRLHDNPDREHIDAFNERWGNLGVTAEQAIERMNAPAGAAPAAGRPAPSTDLQRRSDGSLVDPVTGTVWDHQPTYGELAADRARVAPPPRVTHVPITPPPRLMDVLGRLGGFVERGLHPEQVQEPPAPRTPQP